MDINETCDVLPIGFLTGSLSGEQVRSLAATGAIPAEYVNERAGHVLGVAFFVGAALTAPVWIGMTWVLTHLL